MHLGVRWSSATHPGNLRKQNEDTYLILHFDSKTVSFLGKSGQFSLDENLLFAVGDGMGGENSGEFASRIAIDQMTRIFPKALLQENQVFLDHYEEIFSELYREIHHSLLLLGDSYLECRGMGSTLTTCWLSGNHLRFCHIGDSRFYSITPGTKIEQISHDHTHVGWLLRKGKITPSEARRHPSRNALQKALGSNHQIVSPQIGELPLVDGQMLLLCSDGLSDELSDQQILDILSHPGPLATEHSLAQTLIDQGLRRQGKDNMTAVLLEIISLEST
ncbi:MAG: protein phosphatase 2C domain-containing protein [Verrucomicrobiota bacterium]